MSPLAHLMRGLIVGYQWTLSPFIGRQCRFLPTCSAYALDAIASHGAVRGGWLMVRRLLRCHPWGGSGFDPVPKPADRRAAPTSPATSNCSCHPHPRQGLPGTQ